MGSSEVVQSHLPCPHCPSSDAYSTYTDGHGYCFSCGTYDPPQGNQEVARKVSKDKSLIQGGEHKPLTKRKLTKKTCEFFGYFVADYKGHKVQVAPYYKKRKLVAQHLRFPDKTMPWLGKPEGVQLFGQHLWNSHGKQLIITEGEIDCMSVAQSLNYKWPVVSIPTGAKGAAQAIKDNLEFVNSFEKVVLAFDNDEPGKEAVESVVPLLDPGKVYLFTYPANFKDPNEMLQASEAGRIAEGVFKAQAYRPDGIIDGRDLKEDVKTEPPKGYQVPYPVLNDMFHGLRKGELYLFTAGSGIGKSTLVHELGYHFLTEHKLTLGILALEENKRHTAKRYVGIELNKPLTVTRAGVTDEQIDAAFERTVGSGRFYLYDHWGSTDLDNLMSKLHYMAKALGVDWIILDHISIVVSGLDEIQESERKLIDKLMTRLRTLVENAGVGVLAIVHLNRPNDNSSKSYNEGRQVSLRALRGSGALEQLSDGVIALERDQQDEQKANVSTVRVLKNRPIGRTGMADTLVYNPDTGRLLPEGAAEFMFSEVFSLRCEENQHLHEFEENSDF